MSEVPSYYAWCPSVEKKDLLSVYLTAGRYRQAPAGQRAFFECVLAAVGVDEPLHLWGVHPFTTSYFAGEGWQECWDVRLVMKNTLGAVPDLLGSVLVAADPQVVAEPEDYVQVRVLADFAERRDAQRCGAALRQHAETASAGEGHFSRVLLRDLGRSRTQVRCDVGSARRGRLSELIDVATQAQEICQRHGGRTRAEAGGSVS